MPPRRSAFSGRLICTVIAVIAVIDVPLPFFTTRTTTLAKHFP